MPGSASGSFPSGFTDSPPPRQKLMLWWQPEADTPMNGFDMKARDEIVLACDLGADLAVGGEAIGGAQRIVEREVSSSWPGASSWSPLDHVEPHRPGVLDDPQVHRRRLSNWSMW